MLDYMDQVQAAWLDATNWNRDNSYSNLTATAQALLDFPIPRGLRLSVSSLSATNLATSYALGSVGVVDGSVSYLYSSVPLSNASTSLQSATLGLPSVVQGYRRLREIRRPDEAWWWEVWHRGKRIDKRDTLLYGRLYLPLSTLEALYMRRISPTQQFRLSCVSDSRLRNGGTILLSHQVDTGKISLESLYSTDSALLGLRGLYNFGPLPEDPPHPGISASPTRTPPPPASTRLSLGAELYYGLLNNSFGLSTGLRFSNMPPLHSASSSDSLNVPPAATSSSKSASTTNSNTPGAAASTPSFPFIATLTLNPLMGNISATYAVQGRHPHRLHPLLALASRLDFNVYSWESGVVLGCELWRTGSASPDLSSSSLPPPSGRFSSQAHPVEPTRGSISTGISPITASLPPTSRHEHAFKVPEDEEPETSANDNSVHSILKARIDQSGTIGLLWEGRFKHLLFSLGSSISLARPSSMSGSDVMNASTSHRRTTVATSATDTKNNEGRSSPSPPSQQNQQQQQQRAQLHNESLHYHHHDHHHHHHRYHQPIKAIGIEIQYSS
ncbi:MAG: Mitochondrial distribution and morphology protein 10 [Lichina confinis]|nr:MAG: Mitochondrial distribution and morphology protein 10 [Lichina confinis]